MKNKIKINHCPQHDEDKINHHGMRISSWWKIKLELIIMLWERAHHEDKINPHGSRHDENKININQHVVRMP